MRTVFIDPDGSQPSYVGLIMQHPTGVLYRQQCAGTHCDQRSVEGYYVPLGGGQFGEPTKRVTAEALTAVFHEGEECCWGGYPYNNLPGPNLPPERVEQLRTVVASIPYWGPADRPGDQWPTPLQLDESRVGELVEAWVPVITPDGPGILTWSNCD